MSPAKRIVVSGAGGLIGSALVRSLRQRCEAVGRLVREPEGTGPDRIYWNWERDEIESAKLEGADAVVHLAGRNLTSARWSRGEKSRLYDSRVRGTRLVSRALAGLKQPPRLLVAASAIGYYGDRGPTELDESSPPGTGFLAELCRDWEAACEPAERAGLRVVKLRIGVVLSRAGGALPRMLFPFRLGLGGKLASGRQYMSWIALHDLVRVVHHVIDQPRIDGPVNAVSPEPVTNATLTRVLAKVLRRPAIFRVPGVAIRLIWGEMGEQTLLASTRVLPEKLVRSGFPFGDPQLEPALRRELGASMSP